jgi:hypothetical protein
MVFRASRPYQAATEPSSKKTRAMGRVPPNGYRFRAASVNSLVGSLEHILAAIRAVPYIRTPGEFKLDQGLWGTSPGPATYLREPCLDASGRKESRRGRRAILAELPKLEGRCNDGESMPKIRRSGIVILNLLNTICSCLGEPWA